MESKIAVSLQYLMMRQDVGMSDFHTKSNQKQATDPHHIPSNTPENAPEFPQLTLTQRQVLQLQRTIGNKATLRLLQRQAQIQRDDEAAAAPTPAPDSSSSSSSAPSSPASNAMTGSMSDSMTISGGMMQANILQGTGVSATGPIQLMGPLLLNDVELKMGRYDSAYPDSATFKPKTP
jgi:hypothetical protein